jgi:hypothetical protein
MMQGSNLMKKIKSKYIVIILALWFIFFIVDVLRSEFGSAPIFMLHFTGGEVTCYQGLGYSINHYYSETPTGYDPGYYQINPSIYIILNVLIILFLIFRFIRSRSK